MSQSFDDSVTCQLHLAHNIINNSILREDVLHVLEECGCTRSLIDKGETLYNAATLSVGAELAIEEDVLEIERFYGEIQKKLRSRYTLFTSAAHECFGQNAIEMLGLPHDKPRSGNHYCEYLRLSLAKMNAYPELVKKLEEYGFDSNQLQHATAMIEKYDEMTIILKRKKVDFENATKKRSTAMFTLRGWLTMFTETILDAIEADTHLLNLLEVDKKELLKIAQVEPKRNIMCSCGQS